MTSPSNFQTSKRAKRLAHSPNCSPILYQVTQHDRSAPYTPFISITMASHLPLTAAPPFRFLSLPRELRNNIYALLFDSGPAKLASPKRHSCAYLHDIGAPALRYVNKQVKAEFDEQQQMQGLTLHIPSSLPGVKQLWLLCCAARSASACATQPPVRRLRVDAMLEWLEDWDGRSLLGQLNSVQDCFADVFCRSPRGSDWRPGCHLQGSATYQQR